MKNVVVLVPEGIFLEYFVYSIAQPYEAIRSSADKSTGNIKPLWSGKIRFRGAGASNEGIRRLIERYEPQTVAIRVMYGGEEFKGPVVYDHSVIRRLERLVSESPLHIPIVVKLLKTLEIIVPVPDIILFFETAFFANLPLQERTYAVNSDLIEESSFGEARRFGYHGLFHQAVADKMRSRGENSHKIISICLEPVPEVVAIYNGKPVMVSSGSTPLEGLPGNTTCGDIDPGIVLFLEEKAKRGPEFIDEILTRKSGISAMAGIPITIEQVLENRETYKEASDLFEYRVLTECGSAIAIMNGIDSVVFSGKYVRSGEKLSETLIPKLARATNRKDSPEIHFLHDSVEDIIFKLAVQCELRTNFLPRSLPSFA